MRRLLIQVVSIVGLGFGLLYGLAFWRMVDAAPRQSVDANDITWTCYDDRLASTTPVGVNGDGHLCYAQTGVKAVMDLEDLVPGEMYTAWLAYIEAPAACSVSPCPLREMMQMTPMPPIVKFDGAVVDDTRRTTMTTVFRGLTLPTGAQVQLLLVQHGRAISGESHPAQLLAASWPGVMRDSPAGVGMIGRASFPVR